MHSYHLFILPTFVTTHPCSWRNNVSECLSSSKSEHHAHSTHTFFQDFSTNFFIRENFSVFNARECFVSHLKSPDHSLTLLTLITVVILFAVASSVSRTEGPVASRRCVVCFFVLLSSLGEARVALLYFLFQICRIVELY